MATIAKLSFPVMTARKLSIEELRAERLKNLQLALAEFGDELRYDQKFALQRAAQVVRRIGDSLSAFTDAELFGVTHDGKIVGALLSTAYDPRDVIGGSTPGGERFLREADPPRISRDLPLPADPQALPIWLCGKTHALRNRARRGA